VFCFLSCLRPLPPWSSLNRLLVVSAEPPTDAAMATRELKLTTRPKVRPLSQEDANGIALLVAGVHAENGSRPGMSVEQTEQLLATPWLRNGAGYVLEYGAEIVGYGFTRPTRWRGTDMVELGLLLERGFRDRENYRVLTDRLLLVASEIAVKCGTRDIIVHYRGNDTVHPPVVLELGFREHPVSMLGFRHDLRDVSARPLPPGFAFRPARFPEERAALLNLTASSFDDRGRQGEPMAESYIDFIVGKPGFDLEQILLVENAGDPVGYTIVDSAIYAGDGCYNVLELGVLPGFRNRGVGSALVCRVLDWLKGRGARAALTGMFSSNQVATLYWRLGFRPDPNRTFRFFVRDAAPGSTTEPIVP
jgi:GNAT superfamily N-acetyltransferase